MPFPSAATVVSAPAELATTIGRRSREAHLVDAGVDAATCGAAPAQLKRAPITERALVNASPMLAMPFAGSPFTAM